MRVSESTYKQLPPELQRLFSKLPNPGSDEVVRLFPSPHGAGSARAGSSSPRPANYNGSVPIAPVPNTGNMFRIGDSGSAARFFYCAKASRRERDAGLEGMEAKQGGGMKGTEDQTLLTGSGNIRNNLMRNIHPTVKPLALVEYLCNLTKTPSGGVVLDPFVGSGTTMVACVNTGRDGIGIDTSDEYIDIAQRRVAHAEAQMQPRLM